MATHDSTRARLGVYPGSFNPPTIAHVHLAERAIEQCSLDRLDLVISTVTLGKSNDHLTPIADRLAELHRLADTNPALGVRTTEHSLLADIADGYDVVVMGADKWAQVLDPQWYGGSEQRDAALRRLPRIALAPRPPWPMPADTPSASVPDGLEILVLTVDDQHAPVSATEVRAGRTEWRALPLQD
jgi:Cytidylyltransferase-like